MEKEFCKPTVVISKFSFITTIFKDEKQSFCKYFVKLHICFEHKMPNMNFVRNFFENINKPNLKTIVFCIFNKNIVFIAVDVSNIFSKDKHKLLM